VLSVRKVSRRSASPDMILPLCATLMHAFSVTPAIGSSAMPGRVGIATMGLFDGLFADVGSSTRAPAGFVRASHILLPGNMDAAQATELCERITTGACTFAEAAAEYSTCPSKGKGGDLGLFNSLSSLAFLPYEGKKEDVRAFDEFVFAPTTELGSTSLVTTPFGAHIVRVDARG